LSARAAAAVEPSRATWRKLSRYRVSIVNISWTLIQVILTLVIFLRFAI
jgi:predicted amino acid-binding ACT domain protein